MKIHIRTKRFLLLLGVILSLTSLAACNGKDKEKETPKEASAKLIQKEPSEQAETTPTQDPTPQVTVITEEPTQEPTIALTEPAKEPEDDQPELTDEPTPEAVEPLSDSDYTVTDGVHTVSLNELFDDFVPASPEIELPNNFVGSEIVGELEYKTYTHEYEDYTLYTTNTNYDKIGLDMDSYYISQINVSSKTYHTAREIMIGDDLSEIYEKYGEQDVDDADGLYSVKYEYNNNVIEFDLDDKDQVTSILLYVNNSDINE